MRDGDTGEKREVRRYFEPLDDAPPTETRGATGGGFSRTFLIVTVLIFALFPLVAYLVSTYHLAPSGLPRLP